MEKLYNKHKRWSPSEIDILRSQYPKRPTKEITLFLNRPLSSINSKAREMGLRKKAQGIKWAPWMLDILRNHYPYTKTSLVAEWLEVSRCTVQRKAKELGIFKNDRQNSIAKDRLNYRLSESDKAFIRQYAGRMSFRKIAEAIHFSQSTISMFCEKEGISRFIRRGPSPKDNVSLTPYGKTYLIKHFKNTKNEDLAARMGISTSTLHHLARNYGLKKTAAFMKGCRASAGRAAWKANQEKGWPPKGYRIPDRERNCFKKGDTPLQRLGPEREAERIRKSRDSRKRTMFLEKERVAAGLPQLTRLRVTSQPKRKVSLRYYLKNRGYIVDETAGTAYWNEGTRRATTLERQGCEYYRFAPHTQAEVQAQ